MSEVSVVLKDTRYPSQREYRALNRLASYTGRIWNVIVKEDYGVSKYHSLEYTFESENFLIFKLISDNILGHWYTANTLGYKVDQEYQLNETSIIRLWGGDCNSNRH